MVTEEIFVFYGYEYSISQIIILVLAVLGVLYFSMKLLSIEVFDRSVIRRYISIQSFLRYSLVPIMLVSFIGVLYSIILIVLPIVWYIIFSLMLGEQLFRPRM